MVASGLANEPPPHLKLMQRNVNNRNCTAATIAANTKNREALTVLDTVSAMVSANATDRLDTRLFTTKTNQGIVVYWLKVYFCQRDDDAIGVMWKVLTESALWLSFIVAVSFTFIYGRAYGETACSITVFGTSVFILRQLVAPTDYEWSNLISSSFAVLGFFFSASSLAIGVAYGDGAFCFFLFIALVLRYIPV